MEKIYFDNKDVLTDYGVFLMKESGLLSPLNIKKPFVHEWEDENGEDIYLGEVTFEKREFTLELGIKASSETAFKQAINNFYDWLQSTGLRQLRLTNVDKVFMCYLDKSKPLNRLTHWNSSLMVGTIKMNFVEPEPVSRQYYTDQDPTPSQVSASMQELTDAPVYTIHWGDGDTDELSESLSPVTHDYSAGNYYIVITGRIDKIETLTVTNSTEITW